MKTRAAIYEFHNIFPEQRFPNEFQNSTLFESRDAFQRSLEAWDWSRDRPDSPYGTLVVLEGLSADWTEPLSNSLGVPPSVISLHREWPGNHAAGKCRVPLGETPDRHAILRYRQPLPFRLRRKRKGMLAHTPPPPFGSSRMQLLTREDCRYYFSDGNNHDAAIRTIDSPIREVNDTAADSTTQLVTYWGQILNKESGSWLGSLSRSPFHPNGNTEHG